MTTEEPEIPKWENRELRRANSRDLERWSIRHDYCTKQWDPGDIPINVAGTIYDSHSLTEWIFGWTQQVYPRRTNYFDMPKDHPYRIAADLSRKLRWLTMRLMWLRNETHRVRLAEERAVLGQFEFDGCGIWTMLKDLVGRCEDFMWEKPKETLKQDSAQRFIAAMFDPKRGLHKTKLLMKELRDWNNDWDRDVHWVLEKYWVPRPPPQGRTQSWPAERPSSSASPRPSKPRKSRTI